MRCTIYSPIELLKAKYKRRWKGKDGKWRYEYEEPKRRVPEGGSKKPGPPKDGNGGDGEKPSPFKTWAALKSSNTMGAYVERFMQTYTPAPKEAYLHRMGLRTKFYGLVEKGLTKPSQASFRTDRKGGRKLKQGITGYNVYVIDDFGHGSISIKTFYSLKAVNDFFGLGRTV